MEYISCPEAAKKWGISERRVQKFCEDGRIPGVIKFGRMWMIPKNAEKPSDPRRKKMKVIILRTFLQHFSFKISDTAEKERK